MRKLRELGWAVSANESKEAVTPTLQCEGRGSWMGLCLDGHLLGWMDGWMTMSLPLLLPSNTQQGSPLSPQAGHGMFVRPQGRGNEVILPLNGLCLWWLKIFFPKHPQQNQRAL